MTLNIGPDPLATNPDDYDQILGGPAIPPAAFAPAALPRVQLGASTAAAPVLGGPAPIAPPSGPSSVLGGAAVPNPIMLPTPGTLTDPALLAAAQRAAMGRGPVVLPETTVEGRVPLPGMGGQAIASPSLKPQGGAALDASLAAVGKGAAGAVRAYKNETPGEALMRMQAQQAGERARLLTGNKGDIATSFANQELGITTETEALRAKAKEEADVAEDVKKRAAGYAMQAQDRLDAAKTAADEAAQTRKQADKEFSDAHIDLDKAYGDTGTRLMSSLAVALGTFGSSLGGGPNVALQLVNDRIARVIDAQKVEIEQKKTKASNAAQLFRDMTNVYGDERIATDAYRAKLLDATINAAKAKFGDQLATAHGQEMLGKLEREKTAADLAVDQAIQTNAQQKAIAPVAYRYQVAAASAAAAASAHKEALAHERAVDLIRARGTEDRATETSKTFTTAQGPQAEAKAAETFVGSLKALGIEKPVEARQSYEEMMSLLDKYGDKYKDASSRAGLSLPNFAKSEEGKEFSQGIMRSYGKYEKAATGATYSEQEGQRLMTAFGGSDPTALRRTFESEGNLLRTAEDAAALSVPANLRESTLGAWRGATTSSSALAPIQANVTPHGAGK